MKCCLRNMISATMEENIKETSCTSERGERGEGRGGGRERERERERERKREREGIQTIKMQCLHAWDCQQINKRFSVWEKIDTTLSIPGPSVQYVN